MKSLKSLLIASVSFFGISALLLSSSCEQDPCLDLDCKQGASCSEGFCQCPVGYEGAECDITSASRFVGRYVGGIISFHLLLIKKITCMGKI